jgi:peptidoglycan/xylan/chitin deacetylase (PgdA/CDA1 family)/GNAT superfamily N-acetyltransferase
MKFYLKKLYFLIIRRLGIIRIFQFLHRNQIAILMIHGVMDDLDNPSWKPLRPQLSRDRLREYLSVLSKRYHFISLLDAVEMLSGRRPVRPYSMVLTFDDGYRNNLTHALPILRSFGAPATFFLSTDFIKNPRPFWFDRLDYALQQAQVDGRKVNVGSFAMHLEGGSRESLRKSYKRFRRSAKKQQMSDHDFLQEIEQLASQLEAESGQALADIQKDDDWSAVMSWEQINKSCDGNVTFGSHTVDHIRLDKVDIETARYQLVESKRDIETHTGKPCRILCYPNGGLNDEISALAKECGYHCAVTTREGLNKSGDDVMKLKRINVPADSETTEFLAVIGGVSSMISYIKHFLSYFKKAIKVLKYTCRQVRTRGVRKAFIRTCNEIYSKREYIVTKCDLTIQKEIKLSHVQINISEVTKKDPGDIENLCRIWPSEFGYWRPGYLQSKFIKDLENGDWCFVVRLDGNIVGSVWLQRSDETINNCDFIHYKNERSVGNFFIVPEKRGRGISKPLLIHACNLAKERQIPQILSLISPLRIASLKAHLGAGFKIIGSIKIKTRFGKNKYKFNPHPQDIDNISMNVVKPIFHTRSAIIKNE